MDGKTEANADFIREFLLGDEDDALKDSMISTIECQSPGALALALRLGPLVRLEEPPPAAIPQTTH